MATNKAPLANPPISKTSSLQKELEPETSTPPPSQKVFEANFPSQILTAPTFEEFSITKSNPGPPLPLNPGEPILDNEIQQITAEEFGTKRTWEETGEIPDKEAIKIQSVAAMTKSPRTSHCSSKPPTKQSKKGSSSKPVDLLTKTNTDPSPLQPSPAPKESNPSELPVSEDRPTNDPKLALGTPVPAVPTTRTSEPPSAQAMSSQPQLALPTSSLAASASHKPVSENPNPTIPSDNTPPTTTKTSVEEGGPNSHPADRAAPAQHKPTPAALQSTTNQISPPASGENAPSNPSSSSAPKPAEKPTNLPVCPLTILKSADVQIKVVQIHQELEGIKPSWQKYQTTWASLTPLVQFCAQSMQTSAPTDEFLSPSHNEQWYCPNVIYFALLSTFGNKDNSLPPRCFISTAAKTPHPESSLVCFLHQISHPPQSSISDWAKLVAASVKLISDNLYNPPPPTTDHNQDQLIQGVQVLQHIEAIKNCSSNFDAIEEIPTSDPQPAQQSHSVNVLHEFLNLILDVLSAYVIFQTHALSEAAADRGSEEDQSTAEPHNS
ncbi:hypothetical protein PTTG_05405 [Puccinia triticina 1-1 BBBD Race 1]|uniref:Uncharacterized protein n=1 Tax=Puccinia triticina (isolate 1-1 / race 1 (BBBD)) TaxID=630390 RepID=A0A180GQQ7_PUCT1|nr:hypothetical protein PTTG_05405 [Puccinia triticina 1-1 BBBD Race 1]